MTVRKSEDNFKNVANRFIINTPIQQQPSISYNRRCPYLLPSY